MEYDVQRCTRSCAKTGRALAPGETIYSALFSERGSLVRRDYSAEAWEGPPADAVGWWKFILPASETKKTHWAPNDVMLQWFEQLAEQPEQADLRYVLALLLVRRRVLRLEDTAPDEQHGEVLVLHCPRDETEHRVPSVMPTREREAEIQKQISGLLSSDAPQPATTTES